MSKAPTQVGTSTNNTTNTTLPPSYVQAAQQGLLGAAGNLTIPFASNVPNYTLAGFTPDQEMAFGLARDQAQQAFTQTPLQVSSFGSYTANPASAQAASAEAARANGAQLGQNDISQFFNPYTRDVVGTTTQQLQEANDKQLAAIRARQAAEGAYGGNRGALEESEQNRNFGNTLAQTTAGLNNQGWQNAAQLGLGNAQMRQQTDLQNAGWDQQTALQNAAWQQQANQQNAAWQQQANLFNGQQALQAAQLQNSLNQTPWQQQMQSIQMLLGNGGAQQQLEQQAINVPYTALDIFRGVVPNSNYGSTSAGTASQPIYGASPLQTALGVGTLGLGMLGSSDRTLKTDIQKLGKDEKTGIDMYAYRYKGDPKNTMKVVGPMAQDVEKKFPGSTVRVGGKLAIKGDAARKILGI